MTKASEFGAYRVVVTLVLGVLLAGAAREQSAPPVSSGPTVSCSAHPTTALLGETLIIVAGGTSPQNRPLTYSYSTTAGQISGTTRLATLSTQGAAPGPITVTCTVTDDQNQTASATITVNVVAPAPPPPPPSQGQGAPPPVPLPQPRPPSRPPAAKDGNPHEGKRGNDDSLPRVTGTAVLLPGEIEGAGYGLYSYALISHRPQPDELPKFKAYFRALLDLPTAEAVERYVPRRRINITYLPLDSPAPKWFTMSLDDKVSYAVEHYDFARGAAMVASLSEHTGPGPVIISLLKPLDVSAHPHPVLVQDLTLAQPSLMASYVSYFVQQAAKDQFWEESALSHFSLSLRNALEITAEGLGMSKVAVQGWVKYFS